MFSFDEIKNADAEVAKAMEDELGRQRSHLELIASENLVSKGVMAPYKQICRRISGKEILRRM